MMIEMMKMMMMKKKAWPFMPISDQSERFRARRPGTSQAPTFFIMMMMMKMFMMMMRMMMRRSRLKMMIRHLGNARHLKHLT